MDKNCLETKLVITQSQVLRFDYLPNLIISMSGIGEKTVFDKILPIPDLLSIT